MTTQMETTIKPQLRTKKDARTKTRVLIIDDEVEFTDQVKSELETEGSFDAHAENSAVMGIETARLVQPDIILLDLCMPVIDGGDVLASLQLDPILRDIPVIIISSLISHEETPKEGVLLSNGLVMLPKPVRLDVLFDCIERRVAGML